MIRKHGKTSSDFVTSISRLGHSRSGELPSPQNLVSPHTRFCALSKPIGIFDSGSGGLTFLAAMKRRHPEWSYLYYGDYDNCPYGDRSPDEIQSLTIAGVQKLFDTGATIVILACNTSSAWTLRKLQTEIFPDKKILGVTIPGAEKVVELGLKNVCVFATEQTVKSRAYAERVKILDADTQVTEIALSGDLVRDIEKLLPVQRCHTGEDFEKLFALYGPDGWECDGGEWTKLTEKYFLEQRATLPTGRQESKEQNGGIFKDDQIIRGPDNHMSEKIINPQLGTLNFELITRASAIILGCTHYSYLRKPLQSIFPESVFIDPSEEAADKLGSYMRVHNIPTDTQGAIIFL